MTFVERMRYIKHVLKTPYHFFTETSDRGVLLRLEDNKECKYSFKGFTIIEAIKEAETYIKQEIEAGSLKDIEKDDKNE